MAGMNPWAVLLFLSLSPVEGEIEALERRMAEMINVEREARGIDALRLSPELSDVARAYSRRMAQTGKVHHRLDRPMEDRIRRARPDTCRFGENVSKHTNIDYSLGDLLLSEGHRENLLHPEFTTIGIGIVRADDGYLYITQEFAQSCAERRR